MIHFQHLAFFASCAPSMEIFSIFGSHCTSIHTTNRLCETAKTSDACKCVCVCWWCVRNWSITILLLLLYAFLTTNVLHFPFLCSFVYFPFEIVSWSFFQYKLKHNNPRWSILRISVLLRGEKQKCVMLEVFCWPKLNTHTHSTYITYLLMYNREIDGWCSFVVIFCSFRFTGAWVSAWILEPSAWKMPPKKDAMKFSANSNSILNGVRKMASEWRFQLCMCVPISSDGHGFELSMYGFCLTGFSTLSLRCEPEPI